MDAVRLRREVSELLEEAVKLGLISEDQGEQKEDLELEGQEK